eukprot:CAMPEP_0198244164 /NCGR_PEP_ID=MMETSP1446-20131203/33347_1 /TAXON_ID=1461542 ORGANISM="Unidentified sp, Strain CCMP2111" /NCGR_SAMPLE_ID=MMETSP1446 /ASSEMBLY_ACC=CAM_ASM_001112 /LENGTH=541 /DNA_ID=CAMNT_0043928147 /DNA_START=269 /DNA_END=1894 /DNA_ORIENTATION=+
MKFAVEDEDREHSGGGVGMLGTNRGTFSPSTSSTPWVFSIDDESVGPKESLSRQKKRGFTSSSPSSPSPTNKERSKSFRKELEHLDHCTKVNAQAWIDSYNDSQKLFRELSDVNEEETLDLKSSIFSVVDQNEWFKQETTKYFNANSAKNKPQGHKNRSLHALDDSLKAVKAEIDHVKHLKTMAEKAKREAEEAHRKRLEMEAALEKQRQLAAEKEEQEKMALLQKKKQEEEAEIARQKAEAEAKEKRDLEEKSKAAARSAVSASSSALDWEAECSKAYASHKELAKFIFEASKLERLKLEKPLKKAVNQLSCSMQQISFVSNQVNQFLAGQRAQQNGDARYSYCLLRFTELMVQQGPGLGSSKNLAFAYAELASVLSRSHECLPQLIVAALHRFCPLTVPKHPKGYTAPQGEVKGYVAFYAALCQLDPCPWFQSSGQGWSYLARFLNTIPANERTAIALDSFLQIAGYKMYLSYRRQQLKLFQYINREFVPALCQGDSKDADDIDAVKSRIVKYVEKQQFLQAPEGSAIPQTDDSQHIRC